MSLFFNRYYVRLQYFISSSISHDFQQAYLIPRMVFQLSQVQVGHPDGFRPSIAPSIIVWCNSSTWCSTRLIISHHRRRLMTSIMDLVSPTLVSTSSFRSFPTLHFDSFKKSLFRFMYNPRLATV